MAGPPCPPGLSPSPRAAAVCPAFTGSAGETGAPSGHEPASGGQLASFAQTDAGPPTLKQVGQPCLCASLGRASPCDRQDGRVHHPGCWSLGLHRVCPVSASAPSGSKAPAEPPRVALRPTQPGQGPRTLPGWAGRGLIRSPRTAPTPSGRCPVSSPWHLHGVVRAWTSCYQMPV